MKTDAAGREPRRLAVRGPEAASSATSGDSRLLVIWACLILSLLSWRKDDYYGGGVDSVVVAKSVLALLGLTLVTLRVMTTPGRSGRNALRMRTLSVLSLYVVTTCIGGWAAGSLLSSAVLGIRVLITMATVALIVVAYPKEQALRTCVTVLAAAGLACGLSGLGGVGHHGRLSGGVLPLNPNQIAILLAPPCVFLVWRMLNGRTRWWQASGLLLMLTMVWLTGSRTGIAALAVAILCVVLLSSRLPLGAFLIALVALPVLGYVFMFTNLVSKLALRDGNGEVGTLSSRTIAWSAVVDGPTDFWHRWFGGGLVVKTVPVAGQYWSSQVLDSSWVSGYAQGGIIGLVLMGVFAGLCLLHAFRSPRNNRALTSALVVLVLVQSTLENGLIDSYVLFVAILLPALLCDVVMLRRGAAGGGEEVSDPRHRGSRAIAAKHLVGGAAVGSLTGRGELARRMP